MTRHLLRLLCATVFLLTASHVMAAPTRPNVIVIFIDDLGYGDVGFNGATIPQTPHLDRMAAEGMKFTDFYVGCAVCSGSRTALLTGCHYQRLSMNAVLFPNSKQGLHPDEVTLADMLHEAGYRTACIGKWHLGHLPPCLPTYQGFDYYWGVPYSNDMWIDPANKLAGSIRLREGLTRAQVEAGHKVKNWVPILRNEEVVEYPAEQATLTKRYTEEAIRFITQKHDAPFFLYLPHTMVHRPLAVSEKFNNPAKSLVTNAIEEVDWSVGQILKTLKQTGIAEDTLVVFTSDNGAAVGSSLPLRAKKGSVYDGGIREPTVMWWPSAIPAGSVCREVAASIDMMPTLAHLCGGELPERPIDGKNIWPLMRGEDGARSPHDTYVLMHGPGTVRSGKWKFYPWQEGQGKGDWSRNRNPAKLSRFPVQLYDTVADIGETTNVAEAHPEIVKRLQTAYDRHVAEVKANRRPTAALKRPPGALSAARPNTKKPKPKQTSKTAHQPFSGTKQSFHGFAMWVDGPQRIVEPKQPAPGRPWVWRARFWGHEPQFDKAMLERGFHVVYCDVAGLYGCDQAVKRWNAFYKKLTSKHGLGPRPILEGMSRGGLIVYRWAAANPNKVAAIYGDAPVMDFKSWPGPGKWDRCLAAYGLTAETAKTYRGNPVDILEPIARAQVPILHVVGDTDEVVPVKENTEIAQRRYRALGGTFEVIHKPSVGHHPHSLEDPTPIVAFMEQYRARTQSAKTEKSDVAQ